MLQECLKKSGSRWKFERGKANHAASCGENSGSVQVIEFSYVFPTAIMAVLMLLAVTFILFYYVYAFNLTESAAEQAMGAVGGDRMYWQLSGNSVDKEKQKEIGKELQKKLTGAAVIPGLNFTSGVEENALGTTFSAYAECRYLGKKLFRVRSERDLCKPTEFAQNTDLVGTIMDDTGLTKAIREKFGNFIEKDKQYEIF